MQNVYMIVGNASEIFVIAKSFEEALGKYRDKYPDNVFKSIQQLNRESIKVLE